MADYVTTIASDGAKAIAEFTPTMTSFYLLLRHFKKMTETEIKYQAEGIDLFATDMSVELRDLEILWENLTEAVFDVILHLPAVPQDRDLQRIAFLMKSIFEIEEPNDRAHLVAEARKHRDLFYCASPGAQGEITTRLVQRFFLVFDRMAKLPQFGGAPLELLPADSIGIMLA